MAKINEILCIGTDVNTGISRCTQRPDLLKVAIAAPPDSYILNTDVATDPYTFIQGKIHADNPAVRWYPLPEFINFEAGNSAAGTQSFNYSNSIRTGDDVSAWTFQTIEGGQCGYNAIERFHKQQEAYGFYFMDRAGNLWGRTKVIAGVTRLYPFLMDDIYVPTWIPGTNAATPEYKISFMFKDDQQLRKQLGLLQTGTDYADLQGVNSVDLALVGVVGTAGTVVVDATLVCGGGNMGILFGSTLANVAAWIAINGTTGLEIPLTSVAFNNTLNQYTVDPDQANGNYDVGEPLILKFEPIADLVALGVAYYETPTGVTYTMN